MSRPTTKKQLIRRLLATSRGKIVVWNVLDGFSEGLFDPSDLQTFFSWWRSALPFVDAKAPLPDHSDPLFVTLDLLRLEPRLWLSLDSAYPGFAALGPKPEFRALCRRVTPRRGRNEVLLTTVRTEDLFAYLAADAKNDLLATGSLDTTSDGVTIRAKIGATPLRARAGELKPGTCLGPPGGEVWFTTADVLDDAIRRRDADDVRDQLGLVHVGQGEDRVAVRFSSRALSSSTSGRPTAMDAGSNRRFKARADRSRSRQRKSWGHTAHLASLEVQNGNCDGVPERISHSIDTAILNPVEIVPIGRTALRRGMSTVSNDHAFADRLARGRDDGFLEREILALI